MQLRESESLTINKTEASDSIGSMAGKSEVLGEHHLDQAADPYHIGHLDRGVSEKQKLVGSVSKVDEQFKSAQENLRSLDEKISKSIEKGTAQPSRYYEDIASKSKLAADKLGSLHKEILQRVEQNRKADNLDLVDKLETILKETPPFKVRINDKGARPDEIPALKSQARDLHGLMFQTIDFMHQKGLIGSAELEQFFEDDEILRRFAVHLVLSSNGPSLMTQAMMIPTKLGSSETMKSFILGPQGGGTKLRQLFAQSMQG
ncbi:hypothetical protein MJO28_010179 [Puccinia striiformis f. sp. tritici]|uniref:Uncharacterized protein n=3 Tax=Puccinia striiformis TaxID=27350 RepID=A0A0L0VT15_9BASI|nr:hypothetical protein Pst134EA_018984 [Puccinia striiformis f. sp. tritici]KNF02406.1 hypothetical protein PSTG_04313 [Puccinia striiformis f. sp. tritici PST-78]POW23034.1 hypothetical protein PSHT_00571 [Puccinia striiformis]KAH9458830.1 hypothetical protein Pst134EA_018984 [Puccinia striiformis f. sp. tritici]KAI7944484.1 hypothetical protein MJO28_010179 [Puccinia striiformis f. sp. tritici]KAI7948256.1 hypothetical protein MJO29_009921 [Puccinia striiformis f. sp. tritici]